MIWEGKLIAGGADMQAGPANLPQRDPHLSATPNLKNPTAQGTSTRGAIDLSQGPMAPRVEVPCAASRGPLRLESRSLVAPRVEVPGDKMKTQKC